MLLFGCSPAEAVQGTQEDVLQQPERFDQAPELKGPPVSWEQAEQMVGQWAAVEGTIVRTHNSGRACFLNFAEDWKGRFHLVVFARSFEEYSASPEKLFLNQRVRITGKISEYKGASQIILEDPSQIVFLDGEPVIEEERKRSIPALPMLAMSPSHGWTLVSWNIENFFDVWDDPWARDEVTQPAFVREKRKEGIAQVLRALDADVIALQEVENRGLLQEFVEDYLAGEGFELVLIEGNDTRGIDVALLSKIPIKKVSSHRNVPLVKADGSPTHFQRDLLEVRLDRPRNPSVYVVHLKSQHGDEVADEIRDAEVRGILS
ncbi:MAG: endonuclease/exonuclease/phosphatase family protein, partial [Planctomycetes bacterium]|nr:endonuclease/exonuclease/phosphatase family protein [Planctomycetota bacterium]